jgi:hypothetical protein
MRRGLLLAVAFACLVGALALPGHVSAATGQPVPSLEPRETAELLAKLRDRQVFRTYRVAEDCRPLHAVFYAASDWVRLATRLAANASPCAQYSISVPPVVGQKTRARPGQAVKIRSLGPQFHALAEIHLTTWQAWVASTGSTWYQAGVEARRSMVAAGFDVAAGDTWAVNELTSAIRRGDGAKRAEIRDFLRGLYDAAGEGPPAKGVVFVVGIGQRVSEVGTYKARLQEWLQDAAFWTDMNAYVSDWSQEVYGDVRGYAAPGADAATRRDALVDYLRHSDLLASAGATASGTANAFFASTSSPVANAAWQWSSAFGWTDVSLELMQQYVSAQVYALRNHSVRTGQQADHWGFAWAPRNATQQAFEIFQEDTGVVLERMAAAIRDSQTVVPADPGVNACADGRYCVGDLDGASVVTRWRAFRAWSPTTLGFATPPQTVGAGVVSGPIGLQVQVARVAARPLAPVVATVASSSPSGTFATTPAGPFAPTVTVELPAATFATAQLYYQDTTAGIATLSASGVGVVTGTQPFTVSGAPPVSLRVDPPTSTVLAGGTVTLRAIGVDEFGNARPAAVAWTIEPQSRGTVSPASGSTASFVASSVPGSGVVTATLTTPTASLTANASLVVRPPPAVRVSAIRYGISRGRLVVFTTLVDTRGSRVRNASLTVVLSRNGKVVARASGRTTSGRMTFSGALSPGAYRARVTRVVAPGFSWSGSTPANGFRARQR